MYNRNPQPTPYAGSGYFPSSPSTPQYNTLRVVQPDLRKEPMRKRPKYTRSKTGCLTCRQKKVKCDETKPSCTRCTQGQRDCTWPENVPPRRKPSRPQDTPEERPSTAGSENLSSSASPPNTREHSPRSRPSELSLSLPPRRYIHKLRTSILLPKFCAFFSLSETTLQMPPVNLNGTRRSIVAHHPYESSQNYSFSNQNDSHLHSLPDYSYQSQSQSHHSSHNHLMPTHHSVSSYQPTLLHSSVSALHRSDSVLPPLDMSRFPSAHPHHLPPPATQSWHPTAIAPTLEPIDTFVSHCHCRHCPSSRVSLSAVSRRV
ncbi:hypothetical protein SISSUDRAFT_611897 [Sistotremastrum suecicum HHB10207 ss-3]|uniref:Zn(2)-C6 fungal-type domain-containing protein n=1 Tax=Sistotremastrum suecicum HHB10207 ss-3 TaxID=1314776 RepID=A0A166ICW0_9AGAM|nr:hypothetical protein SISSUDRAFT_611897 [Sistotremastrum suecicum HHB10207 ss-3]